MPGIVTLNPGSGTYRWSLITGCDLGGAQRLAWWIVLLRIVGVNGSQIFSTDIQDPETGGKSLADIVGMVRKRVEWGGRGGRT